MKKLSCFLNKFCRFFKTRGIPHVYDVGRHTGRKRIKKKLKINIYIIYTPPIFFLLPIFYIKKYIYTIFSFNEVSRVEFLATIVNHAIFRVFYVS